MKFIRKRPSGKDKDIPVFEFAFGVEELKALLGITIQARDNLKKIKHYPLEITPMCNRLFNIIKEFQKTLNNYK